VIEIGASQAEGPLVFEAQPPSLAEFRAALVALRVPADHEDDDVVAGLWRRGFGLRAHRIESQAKGFEPRFDFLEMKFERAELLQFAGLEVFGHFGVAPELF